MEIVESSSLGWGRFQLSGTMAQNGTRSPKLCPRSSPSCDYATFMRIQAQSQTCSVSWNRSPTVFTIRENGKTQSTVNFTPTMHKWTPKWKSFCVPLVQVVPKQCVHVYIIWISEGGSFLWGNFLEVKWCLAWKWAQILFRGLAWNKDHCSQIPFPLMVSIPNFAHFTSQMLDIKPSRPDLTPPTQPK